MKRLFLLMTIFILMFSFIGCSKDSGTTPSHIKVVTAGMLAAGMTQGTLAIGSPCAHPELIRPYMDNKVAAWFKLPENINNEKGILGAACSTAVTAIIPMAYGSVTNLVLPKEFGCTGANIGNGAAKLASIACSVIPL